MSYWQQRIGIFGGVCSQRKSLLRCMWRSSSRSIAYILIRVDHMTNIASSLQPLMLDLLRKCRLGLLIASWKGSNSPWATRHEGLIQH